MDKKSAKFSTDFLFSKGSFLIGMGSVLNIRGNYFEFNSSKSSRAADEKAILSDWINVGRDIITGKNKFVDSTNE